MLQILQYIYEKEKSFLKLAYSYLLIYLPDDGNLMNPTVKMTGIVQCWWKNSSH